MDVEERLAALERRLQAAEDQLEIIRLINTYGPAVDSGSSREAADLWLEDGTYNVGGLRPFTGRDDIASIFTGEPHMALVRQGVSHMMATPRITVRGDEAEAVAYSFVILRREEDWHVIRASINLWTLVRTPDGWRVKDRFNRVLNGSPESHQTMRKVFA